jgi:alcohol dehydrogenase YqhD (iron-dependent ADH family)
LPPKALLVEIEKNKIKMPYYGKRGWKITRGEKRKIINKTIKEVLEKLKKRHTL